MTRGMSESKEEGFRYTHRGGYRPGAGRKPLVGRVSVKHAARPVFDVPSALHIVHRAGARAEVLSRRECQPTLEHALQESAEKPNFRLVLAGVGPDRLHLIVEADDKVALRFGMQSIAIRIARQLNRFTGERGQFFADRYDARVLHTRRDIETAVARLETATQETGLAPIALAPAQTALLKDVVGR